MSSQRLPTRFAQVQQQRRKTEEGLSSEASPFGSPNLSSRSPSLASSLSFPSTPATPATPATPPAANTHPTGLKVLADPVDATVDIVALHGIKGHREKTFTKDGVFWLRDFLPSDIPKARIMSWGYDANPFSPSWEKKKKDTVYGHGTTLVSNLWEARLMSNTINRPIIFVAHSMGGLVVKSALIYAHQLPLSNIQGERSIRVCTYGIIFMGTPHRGGNRATIGAAFLDMASLFLPDNVYTDNLNILQAGSSFLDLQQKQYQQISNEYTTVYAYEGRDLPVVKNKVISYSFRVVPKESAVIEGQPNSEVVEIDADHRDMVRFDNINDDGYRTVSHRLWSMARDATARITERWEKAQEVAHAEQQTLIDSYSVDYDLSHPFDMGRFVGRTDELSSLHDILHGPDVLRRTAVIHGMAGMGKTQLALAYAHKHRKEYSAIFWVDASSLTSVRHWLVVAAKRIAARYWIDGLKQALNDIYTGERHDPEVLVALVLSWFNTLDNTNWLIILDNYDNVKSDVTFSEGAAAQNALADSILDKDFDIRPYLPIENHGSVLITTRHAGTHLGTCVALAQFPNVEDGLTVLEHKSDRIRIQYDPVAAELVRKLDNHPLALAFAGAYLQQNPPTTLSDYIRLFGEGELWLEESHAELGSANDRILSAVITVSYGRIRNGIEAVGKLVSLWSHFDAGTMWYELLREGWVHKIGRWFERRSWRQNMPLWFETLVQDHASFDRAMRVLVSYGFASENVRTSDQEYRQYRLQSSVHAYAKDVWRDHYQGQRIAYQCVLNSVEIYCEEFDRGPLEAQLLHVTRAQLDREDKAQPGEYAFVSGWLDGYWGFDHCEAMFQPLFCGSGETAPGIGALKCLVTQVLSRWYNNRDRFAESEALLLHALTWTIMELGPDHLEVFAIVCRLFSLYYAREWSSKLRPIIAQLLQWAFKDEKYDSFASLMILFTLGYMFVDSGMIEGEIQPRLVPFGDGDGITDGVPFGVAEAASCMLEMQKRGLEDALIWKFFWAGMTLRDVMPSHDDECTPKMYNDVLARVKLAAFGDGENSELACRIFGTYYTFVMSATNGIIKDSRKNTYRIKEAWDTEATLESAWRVHHDLLDILDQVELELGESVPAWELSTPTLEKSSTSDSRKTKKERIAREKAEKKERIEREKAEKKERLEREKQAKKDKLEREKQEKKDRKAKKKNGKSESQDDPISLDGLGLGKTSQETPGSEGSGEILGEPSASESGYFTL